jgi:hypothetical protein
MGSPDTKGKNKRSPRPGLQRSVNELLDRLRDGLDQLFPIPQPQRVPVPIPLPLPGRRIRR